MALLTTVTAISAKSDNANNGKGNQISNTVDTLEQYESKIRNPKAKAALEVAVETTEQSQATVESSLNKMAGRPGFLKFIIGPDYKNAGMVRSEIVQLRNQIAKLTRTREGLSAADQAAIDGSISALQSDLDAIETRLSDALKGVSLFGWLNKLLTGFVAPVATPTPTPVGSPVASASPTPTVGPTVSPEPTATPAE